MENLSKTTLIELEPTGICEAYKYPDLDTDRPSFILNPRTLRQYLTDLEERVRNLEAMLNIRAEEKW